MTGQDEVHIVEDPASDPVVAEIADDYARRFRSRSWRRLWRYRWEQYRFQYTLRRHWSSALDKYMLVWMAIVDFAGATLEEHGPAAAERQDTLFEALVLLHTRACQLARVVHHDLSGGYVEDALVRCRTIHEVAMTAQVLAEYGRDPAHSDLAERYLLHKYVTVADFASDLQRHRRALDIGPVDARGLTGLFTTRDQLLSRFGTSYKTDYGWAIGLPGMKKEATFAKLVALTSTQHMRPYYRWASDHSHASSWNVASASQELAGGRQGLIVGPSTSVDHSGMVEAASWSMRALCWCTESLAMGATLEEENANYVPWLVGIDRLLVDAEDAFEAGHTGERRAIARKGGKTHGTVDHGVRNGAEKR